MSEYKPANLPVLIVIANGCKIFSIFYARIKDYEFARADMMKCLHSIAFWLVNER